MKKYIAYVVLVINYLLFVTSGYYIFRWYIDNHKTKEVVNKIQIISKKEVKEDKTISIDFNHLLLENKEVVGWLKVNGTSIDYPVVKHEDNSYYLTHSFNGEENSAGWIFMDSRNHYNNLDFNTIIYGHGRRDGSMFGGLFKTLDQEWVNHDENLIISFTTLNHQYLFKIFSIYYINTVDDYIQLNYSDELLQNVIERSIYQFDEDVSLNDYILTLSTCYNNEKKLVVHAKMVDKK